MPPRILASCPVAPDPAASDPRLDTSSLDRLASLVEQGPDVVIIEVAATASPATATIDPSAEAALVVAAIGAIDGRCPTAVATADPAVARAAVAAGAGLLDDAAGTLAAVAAESGAELIVHRPADATGPSRASGAAITAAATIDAVASELAAALAAARADGVPTAMIDPGVDGDDGTLVLANLDRFAGLDAPIVVTGDPGGAGANVATSTYALAFGAGAIRVHDVRAARQAATVFAGEQHPRRL